MLQHDLTRCQNNLRISARGVVFTEAPVEVKTSAYRNGIQLRHSRTSKVSEDVECAGSKGLQYSCGRDAGQFMGAASKRKSDYAGGAGEELFSKRE